MKIKFIGRGYFPIVQSANGLLCFKRFALYLYDGNRFSIVTRFNVSFLRKFLSLFRVFVRRFGLDEIKGVEIGAGRFFLYFHHHIYLLSGSKLSLIDKMKYDILHLNYCNGNVVWGGYGYNPNKNAVNIYKYNCASGTISEIHAFTNGEINHVHNIIPFKDGFVLLAGDFGDSASIYKCDFEFNNIKKIAFGTQEFRSCVGVISNNHFLYATDTPFQENFLMDYDLESGIVKKISSLNGSIIFYLDNKDSNHLFFSSTVENETSEMDNRRNKYKYNLGKGIKNWNSVLYLFDYENKKLIELITAKKDILPMIPFKYGCFRFPYYCGGKTIFAFGQSLKKYDGKLIEIVYE